MRWDGSDVLRLGGSVLTQTSAELCRAMVSCIGRNDELHCVRTYLF